MTWRPTQSHSSFPASPTWCDSPHRGSPRRCSRGGLT
jgi:hypothetical protein